MIIFALLIVCGLYAWKYKMITPENESQLSQLVLRVAYPAIIFSSALTDEPHIPASELLITTGVIIALLVLLFIGAFAIARLSGYGKMYHGVLKALTIFSNIGFMGVPMIQSLYGNGALIYMAIFLIPFNILFYSYGIAAVKGGSLQGIHVKDLVNEGMIACVLAVVVYLADIPVPYVIKSTVQILGSMTAPLAMLLIGAFLADLHWKEMFTDKRIWAFTILKMVIVPVIIITILSRFTNNAVLLAVCLAAIATPAGNVIPLLAQVYNKEIYPVALKGVALTTIVSVVTMPLVFYLTGLN